MSGIGARRHHHRDLRRFTLKGMALPDNFRDVTAERIGEKFALVGPPMRRIEPTKD
jgi:hypothetical protein